MIVVIVTTTVVVINTTHIDLYFRTTTQQYKNTGIDRGVLSHHHLQSLFLVMCA
jgi:hypothetical protein